jgi:alpha-glucoside transport system substrate-binding protein
MLRSPAAEGWRKIRRTHRGAAWSSVVCLLLGASLLSACGSSDEGEETSARPERPLEQDLVAQAQDAASAAADGEQLGGSLTVIGANAGPQAKLLEAAYKPFEDATGVDVKYQSTTDLQNIVETRVRAGNPPDVVNAFSAGGLTQYAQEGKLVDLSSVLDMATVEKDFDAGLIDAATVDGKLYGVWTEVTNFMVWYNAKAYKGPNPPDTWAQLQDWAGEQANAGNPPWCLALEAGAGTGWPAPLFVENLFMKANGPDKMKQWAAGEIPFTSTEVRQAFEEFGRIATDPKMVKGGPPAILSTSIGEMGLGMFTDPPSCSLMGFGSYSGETILSQNASLKPIEDLDFFPYPPIDPSVPNGELISGKLTYAFNDTPQVRAFMKYLSSAEMQSLLANIGLWAMANKQVQPDAYSNPLIRKSAEALQQADALVPGPDFVQSPAVNTAFRNATVRYLQDPDSLDELLADIEEARRG